MGERRVWMDVQMSPLGDRLLVKPKAKEDVRCLFPLVCRFDEYWCWW